MIPLISQIILRIQRKMFLFFLSCCCLSYVGGEIDLCAESCTTERSLDLTSETEIDFKGNQWTQCLKIPTYISIAACDGDLVHLEFLPGQKVAPLHTNHIFISTFQTESWVRLRDNATGRKLFYKEGFESSDDIEVLSSGNYLTLEHNLLLGDSLNFDIRYSCQPNV